MAYPKVSGLLPLLLVAICYGGAIGGPVKEKTKVLVTVYMESQCGYTYRFLTNQFGPTWDNLKDYIKTDLIPFGKAKAEVIRLPNKQLDFNITCQNGPTECLINQVMACGMDQLGMNDQLYVPYVICLQKKSLNETKPCIDAAGLNYDEVLNCANSFMGRLLQYNNGLITSAFQNPLASVPTITLNGKVSDTIEYHCKDTICGAIPNAEKPDYCKST